jgi:hypothetical protein
VIGYGLAYAYQAMDPDGWNSISDREKATKWIFPLPWTETDADGRKRRAYVAIPKDQFQQVFSAIGQARADAQAGKPWSEQVVMATGSLIPADLGNLAPPVYNAYKAYYDNYDNWSNQKVWRGDENISPSNERKVGTPEIAKQISDLAKAAGMEISPERLAAATSKILPTTNPIVTSSSSLYDMALNDDQVNKTVVDAMKEIPGLNRFVRFGKPIDVGVQAGKMAKGLDVETEGRTEQEVLQEVREKGRTRADERKALDDQLVEVLRQKDIDAFDIRERIAEITTDNDERVRLWNAAKRRKPTVAVGPWQSKIIKRKRR